MRFFTIALVTLISLSSLAAEGALTGMTPSGLVACGGSIGTEDLAMTLVPGTLMMKAEDRAGSFLAYIDFKKAGLLRIGIYSGASDERFEKLESLLKAQTSENPDLADLVKKIGMSASLLLHVGFVENMAHIELNHGDRVVSLSCRILDK